MHSRLLNIITAVLALIYCSNGIQLDAANLDPFIEYLVDKMENYGVWLTTNNLDPSPPTNNSLTLTLTYGSVHLKCEISNQFLSGHSQIENATVDAEASFGPLHYAGMAQQFSTPIQFQGTFNCSGEVQKFAFVDLENNLPFTGQGNYIVTTNSTDEFIEILNLGVTADSKFNFTHIWVTYWSTTQLDNVQLQGTWNDTLIGERYLGSVESAFHVVFNDYIDSRSPNNVMYNPAAQLLYKYLHEILEELVLTDIIGEEDAPPVHIPTPSTTTTTTTTTTTPTTTSTTTPPSPSTPPSSASTVILNCSVILSIMLVIQMIT